MWGTGYSSLEMTASTGSDRYNEAAAGEHRTGRLQSSAVRQRIALLRHYYRAGIRLLTCVLLAAVCAAGQQTRESAQTPERTALGPTRNAVLYGVRVRSITFRGVSADEEVRLSARVEQKVGEPLDRVKIQRSIRALYVTGLLDYIAVEGKREGDGVDLTFVVTRNYFVGAVDVDGLPKKGPNAAQLVNASNLDLGQLFTQEKLEAAF